MRKPYLPTRVVLWVAAAIAAAVLDAPPIVSQILLPLMVVFAVLTPAPSHCLKRSGRP